MNLPIHWTLGYEMVSAAAGLGAISAVLIQRLLLACSGEKIVLPMGLFTFS